MQLYEKIFHYKNWNLFLNFGSVWYNRKENPNSFIDISSIFFFC